MDIGQVFALAASVPLCLIGLSLLALLYILGTLWEILTKEPTASDKLLWVILVLVLGPLGALGYQFIRKPERENERLERLTRPSEEEIERTTRPDRYQIPDTVDYEDVAPVPRRALPQPPPSQPEYNGEGFTRRQILILSVLGVTAGGVFVIALLLVLGGGR